MALVQCPNCNARISSVANECPHCAFSRGELSPEQQKKMQRRSLRDRLYHLRMLSYVAITLMVAGFGWYWWASDSFQQSITAGPAALIALGVAIYLVVRVMLFTTMRSLRELNTP